MVLFIYRSLINIIFILSPIIVLIRIVKKKEDLKRFKEKFCFFSKKKINGNLIWIHVASVGELMSVVPLIFNKVIRNYSLNLDIKYFMMDYFYTNYSYCINKSKILLKPYKIILKLYFYPISILYYCPCYLRCLIELNKLYFID